MYRSISLLAAGVCAVSMIYAGSAQAQKYPERGISVIIPFAPGGQTDIASRVLAEALSGVLGQTVTAVNRAGAGGAVGAAEMAAAKADGYTLGVNTSTPLVQTPHMTKVPYSVDSYDYICRVFFNPLIFAVKKDSEISRPSDLAKYAGRSTVRYGSSGNGSVQHLAMIQFSEQAKVKTTHVPNSSDADNLRNILADVITGTLTSSSVIKANNDSIKPIGVMSRERFAGLPDVPTFAEDGFPVTFGLWGVLVGPKGLPAPILSTLRSACDKAQQTEPFTKRMRDLGMEPAYLDGAKFGVDIKEESTVAGRLLREAGLVK